MTFATAERPKTQPTVLYILNVTQADIDDSVKGDPNRCAVAKALRRSFPNAFSVRVSGYEDIQIIGVCWSARVDSYKSHLSFNIPSEIVKKINHYDRTGEMEPFTMELLI